MDVSLLSLFKHLSKPSARALGLLGGTTTPVSPTIQDESPTSVTTQGTPIAMASPMTFGKPSPKEEEEQTMSKAL